MSDPEQGKIVGALTDGTGVSSIGPQKLIKDFIADFLISAAAALATIQVMDLSAALAAPEVAGLAIAGAAVKAAYRIVLRWATTD
jgi:hypothetical protein